MKETIEFKLLVKDVKEEITEIFFESDEKGETQIIKEQNIGKIFDSISDFQNGVRMNLS